MNTIEVRSLTKFYGDKPALMALISLHVMDYWAIGCKWSGKSTLIKCLSGVLTFSMAMHFSTSIQLFAAELIVSLKLATCLSRRLI